MSKLNAADIARSIGKQAANLMDQSNKPKTKFKDPTRKVSKKGTGLDFTEEEDRPVDYEAPGANMPDEDELELDEVDPQAASFEAQRERADQ